MITPTYQFIMRQGPTPGLVFELVKPEISIGRDMTNDFVINDAEVSRRHVILRLEADGYVVEDQESTNGTFINGQRLMGPHFMNVGEVLTLGENVNLIFDAIRPELAATMVGTLTEPAPPIPPQPKPAAVAQPVYVMPPAQPALEYAAPEPASFSEDLEVPAPKKKRQSWWLLAGCGCLVLLALACAGAVLAIEYFNLWCTIFGSLIPGC